MYFFDLCRLRISSSTPTTISKLPILDLVTSIRRMHS
jgi:hypothetical protein